MEHKAVVVLLCCALAFSVPVVQGWGTEAHQTVVAIAAARLTASASRVRIG